MVALLVLGVAGVVVASAYAGRVVRKHLVDAIEKHYRAKVDLKSFTVLVFPRVVVHGEGLALRKNENSEMPFIKVDSFTTEARIVDLLKKRKRVRMLTLEGLQINVSNETKPESRKSEGTVKKGVPDFVIDEVRADGTTLTIFPKNKAKDPLVFDIKQLHLKSAGSRTAMDYQAVLTNATPPGLIHSEGKFGPFNSDELGDTPVSGKYRFRDADLSVFKGISGMLASDGEFRGTLGNLDVNGSTDIPDFQVRHSGNPVDLKTQFHAIVDGTNGDTQLDPVNVQFQNSQMVAKGKVDGVPGRKGKAVALDVTADNARVEDLLGLVVKGNEPPLKGHAKFHTSFVLLPGKGDVLDRLRLKGSFGLEQTKFSKPDLQQKIAKLSTKAQGKDQPIAAGDTASDFHGNFTLNNAIARFTELRFDVAGARVALEGNYNVDNEQLDFHGHLTMDAKLSQMTTGAKSFFAKIVEPLVTKHDDTVIPIKIVGTRKQPKFGVELGKLLKRQ
jgi:hypothetical protein